MTPEEIQKTKIIAEYMGGKVYGEKYQNCNHFTILPHGLKAKVGGENSSLEDCKYHTSWDSLIPAWSRLSWEGRNLRVISYQQREEWERLFEENFYRHIKHDQVLSAFNLFTEALEWFNLKII